MSDIGIFTKSPNHLPNGILILESKSKENEENLNL